MNYLNTVLWSLGIGMCACNFYIYYNRVVLGEFVRSLINHGAFSPEHTVTLEQLKMDKKALLNSALKSKSNTLYGVVALHEGGFYIPEEKKEKAEKMFFKKGTSFFVVILSSVAILGLVWLLTIVTPYVINIINNVF